MSHFTQKIEDAQKALDTARGNVAELMGMSEAEERDLSENESTQLEGYASEIETTEKRISDLERAEKAMAQRVVEKAAPQLHRLNTWVARSAPRVNFCSSRPQPSS